MLALTYQLSPPANRDDSLFAIVSPAYCSTETDKALRVGRMVVKVRRELRRGEAVDVVSACVHQPRGTQHQSIPALTLQAGKVKHAD